MGLLAPAMLGMVHVTVVLDFMCPWSFIGMKSLSLAMRAHREYARFNLTIVPFEFDPPGTYDTLGMDWTEYCNSYEPATAKYLLEEKLPRAFQLGKELGIEFSMRRRIVETEGVNLALMAAQRHDQDAAMQFALTMLSEHFEHLRDPNDPALLAATLSRLEVPTASWVVEGTGESLMVASHKRTAANAALTRRGRNLGGGGVPWFSVRCGDDRRGVAGSGGSATSPRYFEKLFGTCLTAEQQREIRHNREAQHEKQCDSTSHESTNVKTDDEIAGAVIPAQEDSNAALCTAPAVPIMRVAKLSNAEPSCPTGNCDDFTVMEAFTGHHSPDGRDVSPFLLMHDFGEPSKPLNTRVADDPGPPKKRAEKIVGWHPHRGFDIITYMKEGRGSHADSLGNQAVVRPGGIQWLRCGSGIEHAEGGGNPEHANTHGFQIWINLERRMKMAEPSYGTIQPEDIVEELGSGGGISRIVGGIGSGAFEPEPRNDFVIVDCELPGANTTHRYEVPAVATRRVLVYCYQGAGTVGGTAMKPRQTAYMDAVLAVADGSPEETDQQSANTGSVDREAMVVGAALEMVSSSITGFGVLIFAGLPIEEPISWRGPIVMSTQAEINQAYSELRSGRFYKKRASGDWRAMADRSDVPYATKRVAGTQVPDRPLLGK